VKIEKKNPQLKNQIVNVLRLLADDPFTPSLKSHKLTGNLAGFWSCSFAYDCRIIFNLSEDEKLL
jgi:mRNA interferase YafQ